MLDAEEDSLHSPCLPVASDPQSSGGSPPPDGLAFLARVRAEAAGLPAVLAAELDPRQFDSKRTTYLPRAAPFAQAPPGTEALPEWRAAFTAGFTSLRRALQEAGPASAAKLQLPAARDRDGWRRWCLGSGEEAVGAGEAPSLRLLLQLDEVGASALLHHAAGWLEAVPELSERHAQWLFALLARGATVSSPALRAADAPCPVGAPLDADTCAVIRQLCRRCCELRAALEPGDGQRLEAICIVLAAAEAVQPQGGGGGCVW